MRKILLLICACALLFCSVNSLAEVPKLMNYQGMLTNDLGGPLSGSYDITFRIYDDTTGGNLKWSEAHTGVVVQDGLFNVTLGANTALDLPFDESYWLEVEVAGETMSRLRITSAAYAYRAQRSDTASYALSAPGGSGSEYWTLRVTDTADTTIITQGRWGMARAGNILYGNVDSTHVNLGVSCTTGTSGENYSYCTVAGGDGNASTYFRTTVGGGRQNRASYYYATVAGGGWNSASGYGSVIAGGENNVASGANATVGGGEDNTAGQSHVTIAGGQYNEGTVDHAFVGGGQSNSAQNTCATIGGGQNNVITGSYGTIGGGQRNSAGAWYSTVGGGHYNAAIGQGCTVPGGYADTVDGFYSMAAGSNVRVRDAAWFTFAFGQNFETSTPNAVIFYNTENETKVGIDTASPGNILTVRQGSSTDPVADAWTVYSSKRWKTNVQPIPGALDKVLKLQGVYFDWAADGKHDLGLIAEEVGKVVPEVVVYEENGVDAQSMDYARLVALLVQAMKEQQQEIDLLKAAVGSPPENTR